VPLLADRNLVEFNTEVNFFAF
jgi:hypothetical protein